MKRAYARLKTHISELLYKKEYRCLFTEAILFSVGVYLLVSLFSGGKLLTSIFFLNTDDAFMDFFNSIRDASLGEGSYTVRKVIYPPMANLIFMALSYLTPDEYNATDFKYRKLWDEYTVNIVLIVAFAAICTVLFALAVYKSVKLDKKYKLLVTLTAVFSIPFMNLIERGNIMVIALICLVFFAMTYQSDSALVRELGIIALAFAFSLKLYPILFAWILFAEKRYKEFFRCALYCVLMLILPSFAFGGPVCLWYIVENIFSFSSGAQSATTIISAYTHIPAIIVSGGAYLWFALCTLNFVVSPFVHRDTWKTWINGCIMFLAFPSLTSTYGWGLFIIPMIMICNQRLSGRRHLPYVVLMTVPFILFPIELPIQPTVNTFAVFVFFALISAYSIWDTLGCLKKRKIFVKKS